jgi:hypothetical protein
MHHQGDKITLMKALLLFSTLLIASPIYAQDNCIEVGSAGEYTAMLSNTGSEPLTIICLETDDSHFAIPEGRFVLPMTIPGSSSAMIPVQFTPTEAKEYLAHLIFHFSDSDQFIFDLSGCGKPPQSTIGEAEPAQPLRLWPNPARSTLHLSLPVSESWTGRISSLDGAQVRSLEVSEIQNGVLLETLVRGTYLISVESSSCRYSGKFTKE